MNEFFGTLGVLVAACAPLWFTLLADITTKRLLRIGASVALLLAYALVTVAFGAAVAIAYSWNDPNVQARFLRFFIGALPSFSIVAAVWLPLRRRALRNAEWHRQHPDAERLPRRRRERRAAAEIEQILVWHERATRTMQEAIQTRGWVSGSVVRALDAERPVGKVLRRSTRSLERFIGGQSPHARAVVQDWRQGLRALSGRINEKHLHRVAEEQADFFASIDRAPLTDEQVRAVVCFDDRVRVVAAAGSGKTSTLVAKAVFAVRNGLVTADRVLVLAFNERAAREAQERLVRSFASNEMEGRVTATTFHAFGLSAIGAATGRKPSVARVIEQKRVSEKIAEIVGHLRDADPRFRSEWDLFRNVFFDAVEDETSDDLRADEFLSKSGVIVRSAGERLIADWLWFNGVEFEYERAYPVDTIDERHRQYTPDFYYPGIDTWHEHFALDRFGAAPAAFDGYLDEIAWKRALHARSGTHLFETTTAETDDGSALERIQEMLETRGLQLRPDPSRPSRGRPAVPEARLIELFKKALEQARLTASGDAEAAAASRRTRLFLRLLQPIRLQWEAMLAAEGATDFEGMVVDGARLLEAGEAPAEYDLVLVDEFQDMSSARARLVHALLTRSGSRLFAVGDDWQAINAFSGGDVRQMLEFDQLWGESTTVRLEHTFRSSQPICDVAGDFVQRNPDQLRKSVRSEAERVQHPVTVHAVGSEAGQTSAAEAWLAGLQQKMTNAKTAGKRMVPRSVLFLGRYRWTEQLVPATSSFPDLRCSFSTVHSAKGLEADYVVILDLVNGSDGFPSQKRDDPILSTWASPAEPYPYGEERRLLYVALTRARRAVLVLTDQSHPSTFVEELAAQPQVNFLAADGSRAEMCPKCQSAVLVQRSGPYGAFVTCPSRRGCSFKRNVDRAARASIPALARK